MWCCCFPLFHGKQLRGEKKNKKNTFENASDIFRLLTGGEGQLPCYEGGARGYKCVLWNEDMIYRVFSMCRFELILALLAFALCDSTYVARGDYYYCIIRYVFSCDGVVMVMVMVMVMVVVVVCGVFV